MHHNHLCQSFYDCTLTYTGFAYQDRVVLLAASQDFDNTLYLVFTTDTWVELAEGSALCQVGAEVIQHRSL